MLQIAIVIIYLAAVIVIGMISRKRTWKLADYLVAGRKGTPAQITGSLLATILGGSATIGMVGLGSTRGLTGAWWLLSGTFGLLILGFSFADRVRKFGTLTLPSLIEKQYDGRVALAASVLIVIAWLGVIAGQIIAAGTIMSVLAGNRMMWMAVFSVIFIGYTVVGGQKAVIRTDFLQLCFIVAGIVISFILVMSNTGGLSGMRDGLGSDHFSFPASPNFGAVDIVSSLLIIGLTYVVGPDIYSRLFSAKDGRTARTSALIAAVCLIPLAFIIVIIGMGATVLCPDTTAEKLFPALINTVFPPLAGGIVLAALLGAIMSSADTTLLSAGSILGVNILGKLRKYSGTTGQMKATRWSLVILGLCSLALALRLQGIISSLLFAFTVFSGGVILPVIAGFFNNRLNITPVAALTAIICGGITAIIARLLHVPYLDIGALGVNVILLFTVSFFTRRRHRST